MKIILYLCLPVIVSCNKLRKQAVITPQVDTTMQIDSEEKELYIKSLRLHLGHDKAQNKIVNKISEAITDIFYLQRAQEFQYSNYEYY